MTKREVFKRVRDIILYLEHQQTLPTKTTCSVVAVKEAPASFVYDLSCIHSQLLHSRDDVGILLNRLKQLIHNKER